MSVLTGLAVVAAIFISACVAAYESILRLIHPSTPGHLLILALAGAIGFAGNWLATLVPTRAGHQLESPARSRTEIMPASTHTSHSP